MLKKIFNLGCLGLYLAAMFSWFSPGPARAATDASLSFGQSSVSTSVGQTLSLTVILNPGSNQVESAELYIAFNPNVLRLDSITSAGVFNVSVGPAINNVSGMGYVDLDASAPTGGTSNIATFSFTALATATNSPVSILPASNAFSSGISVVNARTGSWVNVASSGVTLRSDVDNSTVVTSSDALLTLRMSTGLSVSGTNWQESTITGDANCDGNTNSTDALLILRKSLGLSMSGTAWCES